jgi:WD40 repeat protein
MALGERTADGKALLEMFDVRSGKKRWGSDLTVVPETVRDAGAHPWFPFAFHPTKSEMALSRGPGGFETRDCETGDVLENYTTKTGAWNTIQYSADGNCFIAGHAPRAAVIDLSKSGVERLYPNFRCLASLPSPAGELWLTGSSPLDHALRRSPNGPVLRPLGPTSGIIVAVALSADGRWLAAGGLPLEVYLWDLKGNMPASRLIGHDGTIQSVRFTPDGNTLLSLGSDGLLKLWHVPTRSELLTIGSGEDQVQCFGLHPSGQVLVLGIKHGKEFRLRTYRLGDSGESFARTFEVGNPSSP